MSDANIISEYVLEFNLPISQTNPKIQPFKLIFPKKCIVDLLNKKITFHTMVFNESLKYHALKANSFSILNSTGKEYCIFNYKGPQFVLYSDDSNCIVTETTPVLNLNNEMILEPNLNPFNSCDTKKVSKTYGKITIKYFSFVYR